MSGDPEQEYFSDGITEDIITDLSQVSALFVVARNTAFTLKGKSVSAQQAARDLGVKHILEGSVCRSGHRVRISAKLIDGDTAGHLWANRYDRDLEDIFAVQDEVSKSIVNALKATLLPKELEMIASRSTGSAEAYQAYLMARSFFLGGNDRRAYRVARQMYVKATESIRTMRGPGPASPIATRTCCCMAIRTRLSRAFWPTACGRSSRRRT